MRNRTLVAIAALSFVFTWLGQGVAQAAINITTLPGYEVVTSGTFNFGPNGWAGWSANNGKVVLGAKIISGDPISEFSAFRPVGPGETTPFGYTYGANEYGFILQNALNGSNNGVQMELYYANPPAGYTITKSSHIELRCYRVGWMVCSGWRRRERRWLPVLGELVHLRSRPNLQTRVQCGRITRSEPMSRDGSFRMAGTAGSANLYVISFDPPAVVPEPASIAVWSLLGLTLGGTTWWRRRKKAA